MSAPINYGGVAWPGVLLILVIGGWPFLLLLLVLGLILTVVALYMARHPHD